MGEWFPDSSMVFILVASPQHHPSTWFRKSVWQAVTSCTDIIMDSSKALLFSIHLVFYAREGIILIFQEKNCNCLFFADFQVSHFWLKRMK